jgi:hypothetical protein
MAENTEPMPSLLQLFWSYKDTVKGVVERCGVLIGVDNAAGYSVLLEGDTFPYTVTRGEHPGFRHIGLTQPGDQVEFVADGRRRVLLHEFDNITLRDRCPGMRLEDRFSEPSST